LRLRAREQGNRIQFRDDFSRHGQQAGTGNARRVDPGRQVVEAAGNAFFEANRQDDAYAPSVVRGKDRADGAGLRMADQNRRAAVRQIECVGAFEHHVPGPQIGRDVENGFPLEPDALPDHDVSRKTAFIGETAVFPLGTVRRQNNAAEKTILPEFSALPDARQEFLGHVAIGRSGDHDNGLTFQRGLHLRMAGDGFGNETLAGGRCEHKLFHAFSSFCPVGCCVLSGR